VCLSGLLQVDSKNSWPLWKWQICCFLFPWDQFNKRSTSTYICTYSFQSDHAYQGFEGNRAMQLTLFALCECLLWEIKGLATQKIFSKGCQISVRVLYTYLHI
jgi:hypothetical protein